MSLPAAVAQAVDHPSVVVRRFVDDIDAERRSSKVFLILNNNNADFVVGRPRISTPGRLVSCLVALRNMALPELRRRIGHAGRRTFEREFLPPTVMGRVMNWIESDLRA